MKSDTHNYCTICSILDVALVAQLLMLTVDVVVVVNS